MFVLMWSTLLLAVWRNSADTAVASQQESQSCQHGSCLNLSEAEQTAEAGLCVVIPCSFTAKDNVTAQRVVWYKCEGSDLDCNKSLIFDSSKIEPSSEFKGRVSMLETDLSKKNCSITIRNLKKSDSGFYQLRVYGNFSGATDGYMLSNKTNITVTDLHQKPTLTISSPKSGEQTTLTCTAPGLCSKPVPQITWTWRGRAENVFHITGKSSNLTFNLSAEHHGTQVTCKVSFTGNVTTEETLTLNGTDAVMKLLGIFKQLEVIVAFFIGVLLSTIFCCLMRVCCRKKHKSHANVETMEMATHQESPLIEDSQAVEDDHSGPQEAAEEGAGGAAGKPEVEYSTIHFSASKSSSVAKLENLPETTETEYAEIKAEAEERRAREDGQETGNMEEAQEGGGEDTALYSDVKDAIGEI